MPAVEFPQSYRVRLEKNVLMPIALYVQRYRPPEPTVVDAPGYWRAEWEWPLSGTTTRTLYLGAGDLAEGPPAEQARDALEYVATVGMAAPLPCMGGASPGMQPTDQRADDAWSLRPGSPARTSAPTGGSRHRPVQGGTCHIPVTGVGGGGRLTIAMLE